MIGKPTLRECSTCVHFEQRDRDNNPDYGRCIANPPTLVSAPFNGTNASDHDLQRLSHWPGVQIFDVCGQWTRPARYLTPLDVNASDEGAPQ